ncbi:hypothetical protein [Nitratidesulfovibrio liaohensis]|uniref:Class I SAM-dependent methyltransferase n=1 Tax=Nitratidesulfovibrio liaohensis TaxID=2604158 RepID=A0ABY9R2A8_9BACT|nr:hypothetical protein [Nitratidesulfovibrio liaohensis]WMW65277.1 hypothetical protein KPS_003391 [Nitratidesulfovibrio liaohensis]
MRNHIDAITAAARADLENWIARNSSLCELRDVDFEAGFPYNQQHMQALYLLRYYPAYFAENYMMFRWLRERGKTVANIASIGCGSLVDGAAAYYAFDANIAYCGYDIADWAIKGLPLNVRNVLFRQGDIFSVTSWNNDADIFCFSRSLRDFGSRIGGLRSAVANTPFHNDTIYVCATYNLATPEIRNQHRQWLYDFASFFMGYRHVVSEYMNGEAYPNFRYISDVLPWWDHPERQYCTTLVDRCRDNAELECATEACTSRVSRQPMLKFANLSYEILKLER